MTILIRVAEALYPYDFVEDTVETLKNRHWYRSDNTYTIQFGDGHPCEVADMDSYVVVMVVGSDEARVLNVYGWTF